MLKRTLILKGAFQNGKSKIQIRGGHVPDMVTEGPCFSVIMEQVPHLLGKKVTEVRKMLCLPEFRFAGIASRLDSWARRGMIFFIWRNLEGYFFVYLIPSTSHDLEMDDFLENLLDLAMAPDIRFWSGKNYDFQDYEVTRVNKNALEVVGQHRNTHIHVGYAGVGVNLREAMNGISSMFTC